MSMLAMDAAKRWRRVHGLINALSWDEFLPCIGLTVESVDLPAAIPAVLVRDRVILLKRGLSRESSALLVWHEVGHVALHAGGAAFWTSSVGGQHLLRRFERQAWTFALQFPVWQSDVLEAALNGLASNCEIPGTLALVIDDLARSSHQRTRLGLA